MNLVLMLTLGVLCCACSHVRVERQQSAPYRTAEAAARSLTEVELQIRSVADPSQTYTVRSFVRESEVTMIYMMRRDSLMFWGEPYKFLRHSNPDIVYVGATVVDSLTQY